MSQRFIAAATLLVGAPANAFLATPFVAVPSAPHGVLKAMSSDIVVSRTDFLSKATAAAGTLATLSTISPSKAFAEEAVTLPSGVSYTVKKTGDGPAPNVGELVGIRFKATCGDNVIDDIFETPEPYYTRVGTGGLIKGVEEVIPKMRVGDRWLLTVPGPLAFGQKGRPASAGKPRIPPNATILFEVEMVGLPGREQELIDLIGD